jgi:two-component system OmpR family response regulator
MRVLVVEDDLKLAAVIRRGLALEGIAADVAPDGQQALVRAEATRYDVVILDVMLPESDGFEVCRRLREQGNWAAVLMLTARNTRTSRRSSARKATSSMPARVSSSRCCGQRRSRSRSERRC